MARRLWLSDVVEDDAVRILRDAITRVITHDHIDRLRIKDLQVAARRGDRGLGCEIVASLVFNRDRYAVKYLVSELDLCNMNRSQFQHRLDAIGRQLGHALLKGVVDDVEERDREVTIAPTLGKEEFTRMEEHFANHEEPEPPEPPKRKPKPLGKRRRAAGRRV